MNVRTLCLALLAHGEASGYDLKTRWTDGPFAHFVDASFGSIYPALARLEEEGLVSCREEAHPGKPSRKVYSITERGHAAFVASMSEPPGPDTFRSPFAVMAICAPFLSREVVARAIDERLAENRTCLEQMRQGAEPMRPPALQWLLDWGLHHFNHENAYLEANRERLEAIAGTGGPNAPAPDAIAAPASIEAVGN